MSVVISTELCECKGRLIDPDHYVYHNFSPGQCYVDKNTPLSRGIDHSTHNCKSNPDSPLYEERINHPQHYGGDTTYETIKVIEAWGLDFHLGNAVKYISRAGKKEETTYVEDLEKAHAYLTRALTIARGEEPRWK